MPTFERCDKSIDELAEEIIAKFETHKPLKELKVKIDFVFARCDRDDRGNPINDALTKNGIRALGITRKIPLKDRALGRGDAEIALDGDWWEKASPNEQEALLDHELHHVAVKADKAGNVQYDDLGRPQIQLRKHDVEIGWFKCVAERHGLDSQERIQAKRIMYDMGQAFWPELAPSVEITMGDKTTGKLSPGALSNFAKGKATKLK